MAATQKVTINDFNAAEEIAVTNSRVDGLEARLNALKLVVFQKQLLHHSVLTLF